MNKEIKAILEKYNLKISNAMQLHNLNDALIEICELQKQEDNKTFERMIKERIILQSKNIAENE